MADSDVDIPLTTRGVATERPYTIAASTTLPIGTHVCIDSSGLAVRAGDDQGVRYAGVAVRVHAGKVSCATGLEVLSTIQATTAAPAKGVAYGDIVYALDNQTLATRASVTSAVGAAIVNDIPVGRVTEVVSDTSVWVRLGEVDLRS